LKQFILTTILLFLSFTLYAAEPRIVRVGAFNFYPGIFKDSDGVVKGIYVDSLSEIAKYENIRFEYVWGSWSEGLSRIKSGEVDILTSVAYTPERALYMDYGKTPLLTVWSELYVTKKSEIDSITEIQGKKVAIMKGDFNARNFINLVEKFHITVELVEMPSFDEIFKAVADGKVDAGVVNCTFGVSKQKEYNIRSTGVVFNPFDIYFTSAKDKNKDLIEMLDSYLSDWKHKESSVFNKSRQKWSHGNIGAIEVIPGWLIYSFVSLGFMVLLFVSFTVLLRLKIQRATADILHSRELLKHNESKLRSYIDNSPDGVFVVNEEGRYLEVNPAASQITGYSEAELLTLSITDLQPPDSLEKDMQNFQALKQTGHSSDEFQFLHKNSEKRWWSVDGVKLSETRYIGFVRDITSRKIAEEKINNLLKEKEILLQEVHHRIKNNMNTIKGLLSLQISAEKNPSAIVSLRDAENRVQSMILLYDKLFCSANYRELSIKDYIQPLVSEIINTFPNRGIIKLNTNIQDFILNVKVLAPLGIIINELLTNIMKHAFMDMDNGIITLSVELKDTSATLVVHDDGKGLPDTTNLEESSGFGLSLVNMLIEQIGGSIAVERGEGTKFIIIFNVE